jgi:hypothetical protein
VNQNEPSFTETSLAEKYGIKPQTWRKWRTRGRGPAFYRLGGKIRYSLSDVEAWIAANRVEPGARPRQRKAK